jgi:hypothetical protein
VTVRATSALIRLALAGKWAFYVRMVTEAPKDGGIATAVGRAIFETDDFEGIDETSRHGAFVGGMAGAHQDGGIASSYLRAAEQLAAQAVADDAAHEVVLPVVFLYRHALELRLKLAVRPAKLDHDLVKLAETLDVQLLAKRGVGLPSEILDRIREIGKFDPRADAFRFTRRAATKGKPGEAHFNEEVWVDVAHLRRVMRAVDEQLQEAAALLHS